MFLLAFLLSSLQASAQLSGQGPTVTEELDLDPFTSVGLGINAEVYLTPGNTQRVVVEGQRNIIAALKREVRRDAWDIELPSRTSSYDRLIIRITMPTVKNLAIGGSGSIATTQPFEDLDNLTFSIGGSGSIRFAGSSEGLEVSIGGSGSVEAGDLAVQRCQVSIGGSGDASVNVAENLNVSIAGSGDVVYSGRPRISSSIAGSGEVRSN